jgi:hypothetical protein
LEGLTHGRVCFWVSLGRARSRFDAENPHATCHGFFNR